MTMRSSLRTKSLVPPKSCWGPQMLCVYIRWRPHALRNRRSAVSARPVEGRASSEGVVEAGCRFRRVLMSLLRVGPDLTELSANCPLEGTMCMGTLSGGPPPSRPCRICRVRVRCRSMVSWWAAPGPVEPIIARAAQRRSCAPRGLGLPSIGSGSRPSHRRSLCEAEGQPCG